MRSDAHKRLEITLTADMRAVPHVRRFVGQWFGGVLDDDEQAWRAQLASHELLENAFKCSLDRRASLAIEVRDDKRERQVIVCTRNRSNNEHSMVLQREIEQIRGAADSFELYQSMMRESAKRTDGSGLGLVRIRAEAEMELDSYIYEDEVMVVARAVLRRPE